MRKCIFGFFVVTCCFVIGGSTCCIAGSQQCGEAIESAQAAEKSGDLAIAKLLVDLAFVDARVLQCDTGQREKLSQVREDIHVAYIADRLRIAKEVLVRGDGRKALRGIAAAVEAAEEVELELYDIDGMTANAFFAMACQNLSEARDADQDGNSDQRDHLRAQASELLGLAISLDPRIEPLIKKTFGP